LFAGKENDGKLANKAFSGGLFNTENIIKGKESVGKKSEEGRSVLFGNFKIDNLRTEKIDEANV